MEIIKGEDLCGMKFVKDEDGRLVIYEPKGRFVPKKKEQYWQIRTFGSICRNINYNDPGDRWCIRHNLVFRTKEECEDYKWYLEQLDKYSYEFSEEEWKDSSIEKWHFYYNHEINEVEIEVSRIYQFNNYYFTKESINEFRKVVGDERIKKYMFDVWE